MSLAEKLAERSIPEPNSGCWLWTAGVNSRGYGFVWDGETRKQRSAHRALYELNKGTIGEGLFVCHKCDTKLCVNPDHLFLGTSADNIHDMLSKGRGVNQKKTHCKYGHEFTPENIRRYRGNRFCKQCLVINNKTAYASRCLEAKNQGVFKCH